MSSLYVRVMTGFYTHKKTLRLKARIGSDAFWVPPRLWAYAAENQPDGDFSDYTPKEIAELIGYSGDAEAMLQAMLQASFMDSEPLRIHSWEEHNGYHQTFAIRAKKAAEARWAEKKEVTKKEDKDKTRTRQGQDKEASIPSSNATSINDNKQGASLPPPQWLEVFNEWNKQEVLPKCLVMSDQRRRKLEVRLNESFFKANWRPAMTKCQESKFCQGDNDRGWRATFDWFITTDVVSKIMEGKYDRTNNRTNSTKRFDRNAGTLNEGQAAKYGKFMRDKRALEDAQQRELNKGAGNGQPVPV